MGFKFDAARMKGAYDVLDRLSRLPSRVAQPISDALTAHLKEEFETESDPYGTKWAELSPVTYERRVASRGGILQATGTLMDGTVAKPVGKGVGFVAGASYSQYHQGGNGPGPQQPDGMPARPIFPFHGLPEAWAKDIRDIIFKKASAA